MSDERTVVGVLAGSGFYDLPGLRDLREEPVTTPFGEPSAPPVRGRLQEVEVVFVPRHGRGHRLLPSEINYRANVHALKQLGVGRVVSVSAVGSMREGIHPGDLVLPDQIIDRTVGRRSTFFGDGLAGHVGMADPVCAPTAEMLFEAAVAAGYAPARDADRPEKEPKPSRVLRGGTYLCMEGPQFSTRAESRVHRRWDVDVIGMTAATEAKLCREAELCFAILALSTDYDCWHPEEEAVSVAGVVQVLRANVERARTVIATALPQLRGPRTCTCASAARHAILTDRAAVPAAVRDRLQVLFGRYL